MSFNGSERAANTMAVWRSSDIQLFNSLFNFSRHSNGLGGRDSSIIGPSVERSVSQSCKV
jgi:hypothetical protein